VPKENMNIAVVLHGSATKDVLNNDAYYRFFKNQNPNIELINKLIDADVKIYVCGQTYTGNAYNKEDKLPKVRMAISAMTALVMYQTEGYQIINFN
jgi:intracellular sulfur oxidation DsrE/DsrF family protein